MSFNSFLSRVIFVFVNTDLLLEDLPYCPADKALGGISTRIWYAPVGYFGNLGEPAANSNFEACKIISKKNVSLFENKELCYIDVFLEQNMLKEVSAAIGIRRWKLSTELSFSILEMNARNLGFIDKVKNQPLIFFIPDANARVWIFGSKKNPAYLSSYEGSTGKKYEDDNIINVSFKANTALYIYDGTVADIKTIGGFTKGFTRGFRI